MSLGAYINQDNTSVSFSNSFIVYMLSHLEDLQSKYDEISNQREEDLIKRAKNEFLYPKKEDTLKILKEDGNKSEMTHLRISTIPFTDELIIYGRVDDERNLIEKILKSEKQVVALLGMGGLGKTRLAKNIYINKYIEDHFALRIWVSVSDDFNVKRITEDALDSATQKNWSFNVFSVIQEKLQKELKGKRFFLVLDDVWIEHQYEWECLGFLSNLGSHGSKILITTRSKITAEEIYPTMNYLIYDLKKLDYKNSLELFRSIAFHGLDDQKRGELENMTPMIVKMCYGLPLLINVIGKLLHNTNGDKEKWRTITQSDAWKTRIILNTYKISYDNLSNELKQCFLYCSVFPKGRRFSRGELAKLWIAQGLIKDGDSKPVKEVEIECVDGLLHRSLLQQHKSRWREDKYSMHDIMHDLANYILRVEKTMVSQYSNYMNKCVEPINGRTFHHSLYPKPKEISSDSFDGIIKHIRVMICENSYFDTILDSVGNLKHLRYLDIIGEIPSFPKAICQLYNLQTIHLDLALMHYRYFEFPEDMKNMKKLQHIYMSPRMKLTNGIGELVHIQTLSPKIGVTRNGEYCTISELGNLSCLGGTLAIKGLENVMTIDEARSAKLKLKKNIEILEFDWDVRRDVSNKNLKMRYTDILENLLPNESLRELKISRYHGLRFPYWLINGSLTNLVVLVLSQCTCEKLPVLGKIPFLKHLTFNLFNNLKRVGNEIYDSENPEGSFNSLESLHFFGISNWTEWNQVDVCNFHSLRILCIVRCPNLVVSNASRMLGKLQRLKVSDSSNFTEWCRKHADTCLSQVEELVLDYDTYYYPRRFGTGTFRDSASYGSSTSISAIENKILKLIDELKYDSLVKKRDATEKILGLTEHKQKSYTMLLLVTSGAIKPLTSMLLSPDLKIQENAVHILKNLSFIEEYCNEIAKVYAIKPLIHVLKTGILNARGSSAIILGKLSRTKEYNFEIGRSGSINPLLELLTCGDIQGRKNASYALYRLSKYKENIVRILEAGCVKKIMDSMDSKITVFDYEIGILWNLATIPNGRSEIYNNGAIQILMKWLHLGSAVVKYYVVSALLEICTNSNLFCSIVLQEGVVLPLIALSQSNYNAKEKAISLLNHFNSVTCDNNNEDMLLDIQTMFNNDKQHSDDVKKIYNEDLSSTKVVEESSQSPNICSHAVGIEQVDNTIIKWKDQICSTIEDEEDQHHPTGNYQDVKRTFSYFDKDLADISKRIRIRPPIFQEYE